jgi:hypothetical protein
MNCDDTVKNAKLIISEYNIFSDNIDADPVVHEFLHLVRADDRIKGKVGPVLN